MDSTECYLLVPSGRERVFLRRYVPHGSGGPCEQMGTEGYSYHQAKVYIGDRRVELDEEGRRVPPPLREYLDHARWPEFCGCGRRFLPDEPWQVAVETLYQSDRQGECSIQEAAPGAMLDATWLARKGPDGMSLVVKLPTGDLWPVDYPKQGHQTWTRWGAVPHVTADPSVGFGGWFGHLRDGYLVPAA